MATMVFWGKKVILKCSNSIFSGIYEDILNIIYEQNLSYNENLSNLINMLELCSDGWTIHLEEYIYKKKDLETL